MSRLPVPKVIIREIRTSVRRACNWRAIVTGAQFPMSCRVEDFSSGGCRVSMKTTGPFKLGQVVIIEIKSQSIILDGEIVWMKDSEFGMRFLFGEKSVDFAGKN